MKASFLTDLISLALVGLLLIVVEGRGSCKFNPYVKKKHTSCRRVHCDTPPFLWACERCVTSYSSSFVETGFDFCVNQEDDTQVHQFTMDDVRFDFHPATTNDDWKLLRKNGDCEDQSWCKDRVIDGGSCNNKIEEAEVDGEIHKFFYCKVDNSGGGGTSSDCSNWNPLC